MTWLMGSERLNCGIFARRGIAQYLAETFSGLKIKELEWFENPREKTLKNGEPKVSVCFQEYDYEVQVLANNFEEFIGMLISLEELE